MQQKMESLSNSLKHHVFEGERLTAFSDAVYAIIATIMVIPLKIEKSDLEEKDFDLEEYLLQGDFYKNLGIYLFAFLVVIQSWYSHNRMFRLIEKVDDFITWLNLIVLLFTSLLPAAIVLIYNFKYSPILISLSSAIIVLMDISMIVLVFFAFRQHNILHPDLAKVFEMKYLKLTMYLPLMTQPVLGILAIIFAWAVPSVPEISETFFFTMGWFGIFFRFIWWQFQKCYLRRKGHPVPNQIRTLLMSDVVTKERVLAFSDGIFSIVATIIVLDITTVDIVNSAKEHNGNIMDFIKHDYGIILAYISSFIIVGLLWFNHHSMFHFFKKTTSSITVFNSINLLFIGLVPFGSGLIVDFATQITDSSFEINRINSIRAFSLILIIASSSQLLVWGIAHCQKSKCMTDEINHTLMESIQLWKLLVFPVMGLLFYFVTFYSPVTINHFFSYMVIATPFLFIFPRLLISFYKCIKPRVPRFQRSRPSSFASDYRYRKVHIQGQVADDVDDQVYEKNQEKNYLITHTTFAPTEQRIDDSQGFIV